MIKIYRRPKQLIDWCNRLPLPRGMSRRDLVRMLVTAFGLPVLLRLEREAMAADYFGVTSGDGSTLGVVTCWNNVAVSTTFTCPGSGSKTITELSLNCKGTGNIRCAIYALDGLTKIAEGSAEVAVAAGSAWKGHGPAMDNALSPAAPTLTGGTDYRLAATTDNALVEWTYLSGFTYGDIKYDTSDYTGGFPATLTGGESRTTMITVRCGVITTPSAGGGRLTLLGVGK